VWEDLLQYIFYVDGEHNKKI